MKHAALMAVALSLCALGAAIAEEPASLPKILEQQQALQAGLDAGKTSGMTPRQVGIVRKAQKEVFTLAAGKSSLDELSIEDKVRLENALERINAQVKGGDHVATEAQDVCWRERATGSTLKVTRCGTQAERDEAREGARGWMEKPKVCVPPGCGG